MEDRNVTLICSAATLAQAEELASQFPGGSGTFSVRLKEVGAPNVPTYYCGSGYVAAEMARAFEVNVNPMFKVFDNEGKTFNQILSECAPPLDRVVDEL